MNISEYVQYDGLGLAKLVKDGEVTAEELTSLARQAAEQVNGSLNAVVGYLDTVRSDSPDPNARFMGVPTFIKDIGASIEGIILEMGSRFTSGFKATFTTVFASRVLDAGFSIIGRSTCPEFGLTLTTESIAHGRTCNPWNLEHITGGSSGGSAALVASGVVPLAHSNDGGGSTRIPASICGNVGLKASRGRITHAPLTSDVSSPLVAQGCNSRTVRDTAAFLDAVAGPAPGESMISAPTESFLARLDDRPQHYRIAMSLDDWGPATMEAEIRSEVERIGQLLRDMGHRVEEATPDIVRGGGIMAMFATLWYTLAEAAVAELAPLTKRVPDADSLEPITLKMVEAGSKITALDLKKALAFTNTVSRALGLFFEEWDLILTPTLSRATPKHGSNLALQSDVPLQKWLEEVSSYIPHTPVANLTGVPAISVPCGIGPGELPLGIHFFAPMGGEAQLLDIAQQLEKAEPWCNRRPNIFAA
jgi:amidase